MARWQSKLSGLRAAKRTKIDGISFASKAEAQVYAELKLRQAAKEITDLRPHPRFPLHAKGGGKVGTYVADFVYHENGGDVVIDVKPPKFSTPLAKWKMRHFEAEYGHIMTFRIYERKA
tara:strand:+ start:5838 stop:6194 length:357 start_codon:yes stop_codon:yes gene_type:complete